MASEWERRIRVRRSARTVLRVGAVVVVFAWLFWSPPQEGQVFERGGRTPAAGVTVFAAYGSWDTGWAVTDAQGRFRIPSRLAVGALRCGGLVKPVYHLARPGGGALIKLAHTGNPDLDDSSAPGLQLFLESKLVAHRPGDAHWCARMSDAACAHLEAVLAPR